MVFVTSLPCMPLPQNLPLTVMAGCTSGEALVTCGAKIMSASQALVAAARDSYNLKLASVLIEVRGVG